MHFKTIDGGRKVAVARIIMTNEAGLAIVASRSGIPMIINPTGNVASDSPVEEEAVLFCPQLTWVSDK